MGNATERRPTKIETTRNKKSRRANELNECSKMDMGHLTDFSLAGGRTPF